MIPFGSVTLRGVTFVSGMNTTLMLDGVSGLFGGPEVVGRVQAWSSRDGSTPLGPDRARGRMVTVEVTVNCSTPAEAFGLSRDVLAAWAPVREGVVPLGFTVDGAAFRVMGRPRTVDIDAGLLPHGVLRARLPFECTDPRIYDATSAGSLLLALPAPGSTGGFVAPITFPYAATGGSGAASPSDGVAVNAGRVESPWTATITATTDIVGPKLILADTGEFVELTGTVPAGQQLVLDGGSRSIRLAGSPRPSWLSFPSKWWLLPAGSSTVRFRAVSGSGSAVLEWGSAWL